MSVQDALLTNAFTQFQVNDEPPVQVDPQQRTRFIPPDPIKGRNEQLAPIYKEMRDILKECGGNLTPDQQQKLDNCEAAIKTILRRFGMGASGAVFKDSIQVESKIFIQDMEVVMSTIGRFLHATDADYAEGYRKLLAGIPGEDGVAKVAADNAKVMDAKLKKAEAGDLKALDWFYRVFEYGADLRMRLYDIPNTKGMGKNGAPLKVSCGADLLAFKNGNAREQKLFHGLFDRARGKVNWKSTVKVPDLISTGNIKLPELREGAVKETYYRGKSIQDASAMEYARGDNA